MSGSGAIVGADLPGKITIGCNNVIGHHAIVGIECQDLNTRYVIFFSPNIFLTLLLFMANFSFSKVGT